MTRTHEHSPATLASSPAYHSIHLCFLPHPPSIHTHTARGESKPHILSMYSSYFKTQEIRAEVSTMSSSVPVQPYLGLREYSRLYLPWCFKRESWYTRPCCVYVCKCANCANARNDGTADSRGRTRQLAPNRKELLDTRFAPPLKRSKSERAVHPLRKRHP